MNLKQYVYISKSTTKFGKLELEDLAKSAARENDRFSVSGFLVFHNNIFWQYIEGKKENIDNLSKNIQRDNRHRILADSYSRSSNRRFPTWSMKLIEISEQGSFKVNPMHYIQDIMNSSLSKIKDDEFINGIWCSVEEIAYIYEITEKLINKNIEHGLSDIGHLSRSNLTKNLKNDLSDTKYKLKKSDADLSIALHEAMQAKHEAEKANEAKRVFLANISYEIRTPLTSIIGFLDLIKKSSLNDNPDVNRYIDTISNSANHLSDLVGDILDFSKIESDKFEIQAKEFNLINEVVKMKSIFLEKSKQKGIPLNIMLNTSVEYLESDPKLIRQILLN